MLTGRAPDAAALSARGAAADRDRQGQLLARAEKLRSLGEMAGGIVHDLNQNLNLIVGHAQIALRGLDDPEVDPARQREELRELLGIIAHSALEGAQKLNRLQSFAKPREETPAERFDLGELVREVAQLTSPRWKDMPQAQGRPIRLIQEIEGETAVMGWPAMLREALINLIFNAVDAMPRGGTIRVRVRRQEGQVLVDVADTGVGMSPEVQARIFEPFFSTKGDQGTGLGLVNVYGAVQQHDGRVEVDSTPDRGTTFHLCFPAAPYLSQHAMARPAERKPQPTAVENGRRLRILVVDDEPKMCRMVNRMLTPHGHEVTEAYSAEDGLATMAAKPHDLIISDLGLGAGMNGWEFAERVRDAYPRARFILATGWGNSIDEERARLFNVSGIVGKPYSIDTLVGAVQAAVDQR